jgi:hypothetical protein
MFALLEIHFYVVDNVIIIILQVRRLGKWFENYIFEKPSVS